jgi:Fe-S-cluster containining protein
MTHQSNESTRALLEYLQAHGQAVKKRFRPLLRRLKKKPPNNLDERAQAAHEEAFAEIECLHCAHCCKTVGPRVAERDIERLAKRLRMKPGAFAEHYLRRDEDGDWVMQSLPCPFLLPDHTCMVYEDRPKACRGFPHTDQRKFHQVLGVTMVNVGHCPAAFRVVQRLEAIYGS